MEITRLRIYDPVCFYSAMTPVDNKWVALFTHGEGWHNYHHVFPWDYKAAELGNYEHNFSTGIIDFFAKMGIIK